MPQAPPWFAAATSRCRLITHRIVSNADVTAANPSAALPLEFIAACVVLRDFTLSIDETRRFRPDRKA